MVNKKDWSEFRSAGLLWFVNSILHAFGWAIVCVIEGDEVREVYPARVKFRGFSEGINSNGYTRLTKHLSENMEDLLLEVEDGQ